MSQEFADEDQLPENPYTVWSLMEVLGREFDLDPQTVVTMLIVGYAANEWRTVGDLRKWMQEQYDILDIVRPWEGETYRLGG